MRIDRRILGFSLWSSVELATRSYCREALVLQSGSNWVDAFPSDVVARICKQIGDDFSCDDIELFLSETHFPELTSVLLKTLAFRSTCESLGVKDADFRTIASQLYAQRNRIAHLKSEITLFDLDRLCQHGKEYAPLLGRHGASILDSIELFRERPHTIKVEIPHTFYSEVAPEIACPSNLPPMDYESDGGFVGRKDDLAKLKKYVLGQESIVSVLGAGGVGKTALVHHFVSNLLFSNNKRFDSIIWYSAKERYLSDRGIQEIGRTKPHYEAMLDEILLANGCQSEVLSPLVQKETWCQYIFSESSRGMLLVVDNLETIQDERAKEFLKDLPNRNLNRVIITSRVGLGEIERICAIKELSTSDARILIRTVAYEKGLDGIYQLSDESLDELAARMHRFPLSIKWVLGQASLGRDLQLAIEKISNATGDLAKFCFEELFSSYLTETAKLVLFALAFSPSKAGIPYLVFMTGLGPEELDDSIAELKKCSLILQLYSEKAETNFSILGITKKYTSEQLKLRPKLQNELESKFRTFRTVQIEGSSTSVDLLNEESTDFEKLARLKINQALQYRHIGDIEGCRKEFAAAVQVAPLFAKPYFEWSRCELEFRNNAEARQKIELALDLKPDKVKYWVFFAQMLFDSQDYEACREAVKRILEIEPNSSSVKIIVARLEKLSRNYTAAITIFKEVTEDSSSSLTDKHLCIYEWCDCIRRQYETIAEGWEEGLTEALQLCESANQDGRNERLKFMKANLLLEMANCCRESDRSAEVIGFCRQVLEITPVIP
ncbi:MAG: hypothetical protein C0508_06660, partial [Cyanobacteria bacterium PR.023]|nr:hypothetical protein [Cyanobacteria bacterium PR.023]